MNKWEISFVNNGVYCEVTIYCEELNDVYKKIKEYFYIDDIFNIRSIKLIEVDW